MGPQVFWQILYGVRRHGRALASGYLPAASSAGAGLRSRLRPLGREQGDHEGAGNPPRWHAVRADLVREGVLRGEQVLAGATLDACEQAGTYLYDPPGPYPLWQHRSA